MRDALHLAILVYGPPGSGKSYIATALAKQDQRIRVISNDCIRRELGVPPIGHVYTEQVYREAARRAEDALLTNQIVLLESTYYLKRYRRPAFEALARHECRWLLVEMVTPVPLCRARIVERMRVGESRQDGIADAQRFDRLVEKTEPIALDELRQPRGSMMIDGSGRHPVVSRQYGPIPPELLNLFWAFCVDGAGEDSRE